MALLNRPLTAAEIKAAIETPASVLFDRTLMMLISEPRHTYVNYSAAENEVVYTPPEVFHWQARCNRRASDCTWMVPHPTPWLL